MSSVHSNSAETALEPSNRKSIEMLQLPELSKEEMEKLAKNLDAEGLKFFGILKAAGIEKNRWLEFANRRLEILEEDDISDVDCIDKSTQGPLSQDELGLIRSLELPSDPSTYLVESNLRLNLNGIFGGHIQIQISNLPELTTNDKTRFELNSSNPRSTSIIF